MNGNAGASVLEDVSHTLYSGCHLHQFLVQSGNGIHRVIGVYYVSVGCSPLVGEFSM